MVPWRLTPGRALWLSWCGFWCLAWFVLGLVTLVLPFWLLIPPSAAMAALIAIRRADE
jgi:hypothetical protein